MKKLLSLFLALMAVVCLLCVTVHAETAAILSDDLQTLTLFERAYSRADLSAMDLFYDGPPFEVQVPKSMQAQVKNAIAYSSYNQWVIAVEIYYLDGSRQDICFAYDDVKEELLRLCQDDELVCSIEFWWEGDSSSVKAPISQFKGTPVSLEGSELIYDFRYQVTYYYRELSTMVYRGCICDYMGEYFYIDYRENNIPSPTNFYPSEWPGSLKVYQITDEQLIEQIEEALDSQYSGVTTSGQTLSAIFLCFVFAVIPLAILILCAIFAIRSRGYYRLTWAVTAGLCAAELSVFVIIVSNILLA